jgi:hypothetical protein
MTDEEKLLVKPQNPIAHWQLKLQYIDEVGNVFKKGTFIGTKDELGITDTPPPIPPEKPVQKDPKKVESEVVDKSQATIDKLLDILASQGKGQPLAQEIAQAINDVQMGRRIHRGLDTIDPKDILDPPVTIAASGSMFAMYDYRARNGEITTNPTGEVILLKYRGSKEFKTDKEENQRHFCTTEIRSLKLLEWIRQAPYYGTVVFENANEALSMSPNVVQEMAQLWTRIDKMERGQLVNIAKAKVPNAGGLPIEQLKHEAAKIMADEMIKQKYESHMEKSKAMAFSDLFTK